MTAVAPLTPPTLTIPAKKLPSFFGIWKGTRNNLSHRPREAYEAPTWGAPGRFAEKPSPWSAGAPYMPFGAGPRIGIGAIFAMAEAQIVMATLLAPIVLDSRTSARRCRSPA
jgi:hypothetical protein